MITGLDRNIKARARKLKRTTSTSAFKAVKNEKGETFDRDGEADFPSSCDGNGHVTHHVSHDLP